jgi:putative molybdopterin biosynthesis protein
VLVLAGSSAGRDDHTASVLRALGTVVVQGVAVRPGHPVLLGALSGPPPVPVVGVPGYPVSAAVALELFVVPLLADLQGRATVPPLSVQARLTEAVAGHAGVEEYLLVTLPGDGTARPLPRGAGAHAALARADGVLRLGPSSGGHAAGETVPVLLVDAPGWGGPGVAAERRAAG